MKKIAPGTGERHEDLFVDTRGKITRLPSDFYYRELTDVEYHFNSTNREIHVTYNRNTYPADIAITLKGNDPDLLLSMLTLWDKMAAEIFNTKAKILSPEKFISENSMKEIILWCKNYGYPFSFSVEPQPYHSKRLFDLDTGKQLEFNLSEFVSRLNEVYGMFCLYKLLQYPDDEITETVYIDKSISKHGFPELTTIWQLYNESEKNTCIKMLEDKYSAIDLSSKISLNGAPHIEVTVNNLFDAALYELMILLNSPYKNQSVKICPSCGKYFIPERRNQKYCHTPNPNLTSEWTCYAQKQYKREQSAKRKSDTTKDATK